MTKYAIYTQWMGTSKYTCEAESEEEVRKSLINHDGYPENIVLELEND